MHLSGVRASHMGSELLIVSGRMEWSERQYVVGEVIIQLGEILGE